MSDIRVNRWLHQSGTGGVYQDSTGRVGIGTSVPTSALDVQSGTIKIGSNTLSSSGVSTFTTVNTTTLNSTTVTATTITGVTTAGITTAYIGAVNDGPLSGFRNKIINGDMRVDQRNNGASVSVTGDGFGNRQFPVDRFNIQKNSTCVISGIQTSDVPTGQGFSNALRAQVTTADATIAAGDYAFISHRFEGYNVADLHYGTTNAKTATLSFWVKSSISGTYCVSISNYADNRAIPINYSINSPDTWEYKTITISGDTTGTWEKTSSGGMNMSWTLGAGTDYQATNNIWTGSIELATSSQTQWISTLNSTFFITGVQLEAGTVATPFERRSFGQELALCQRYCFVEDNDDGSGGYGSYRWFAYGHTDSTTTATVCRFFPVKMRMAPSGTISNQTHFITDRGQGATTLTALSVSGFTTPFSARLLCTVASGLTAGQPTALASDGTLSRRYIIYNAEL